MHCPSYPSTVTHWIIVTPLRLNLLGRREGTTQQLCFGPALKFRLIFGEINVEHPVCLFNYSLM